MKLIDRYIGREILVTTLFAVTVLSVVLVLGNVFKQLLDYFVNRGVPLQYLVSFVAYILPFSLTYTIPWGLLTAVLLVLGKLSGENELIALRSCGVSMPRICFPLIFLSVVCVCICLWINLEVAPRAQTQMKKALVDIATKDPLSLFSSDHIIDEFPGRKIYVEEKNGKELKNILVYEMHTDTDPIPERVVFARKGVVETTGTEVLLHIYDARFEERDPNNLDDLNKIREGITMKESVFSISLEELLQKSQHAHGPAQMALRELLNSDKVEKIQAKGGQSATATLMHTVLQTELNKRFSFALASFALVLVGIPFAITAHRKETSIGILFSFIIALSYFIFGSLANMVQYQPKFHPEILIWLPNVLCIGLGSVLFRRMSKS